MFKSHKISGPEGKWGANTSKARILDPGCSLPLFPKGEKGITHQTCYVTPRCIAIPWFPLPWSHTTSFPARSEVFGPKFCEFQSLSLASQMWATGFMRKSDNVVHKPHFGLECHKTYPFRQVVSFEFSKDKGSGALCNHVMNMQWNLLFVWNS